MGLCNKATLNQTLWNILITDCKDLKKTSSRVEFEIMRIRNRVRIEKSQGASSADFHFTDCYFVT